ncbi:hypothetical protein AnigIFM50267_010907 [Aspergillus niger]|nr:hypothetical protein AnigIFM50267_010907 [Aspergillus niger]
MTFSATGELLTETLLEDCVLLQLWEWRTKTLLLKIIDDSLDWKDCQSLDSDTIMHFSPSEKAVTTWHRSTGLQRWDYETGQRLVKIPTPDSKARVTLSPSGKIFVVATAQADRTPITKLYDSATGECLTSLRGIKDDPSFVFNSESRVLISADMKGIIRVWDLSSDLRSEQLAAPLKSDGRLILSHDHQFVLSASTNHIYLWKNRPGSLMRVVSRKDIEGLAEMFGQVLIRDYKGPILTNIQTAVQEMNTNQHLDDLFHGYFVDNQIKEISSNGRLLAKAWFSTESAHYDDDNFYITVRDVITGDVASAIPRGYNGDPYLSFSPDGRLLAIGHTDRDSKATTLEVWDVIEGDFRVQRDTGLREEFEAIKVHWSANGTKVAIDCPIPFWKQRNKARIFLYDLAKDNSVLLEYPGVSAALSPDQRLVATRDLDGRILYLWENVGNNLTLLGQHNDLNLKWSVVGSKMLKFEGDEVVITRENRIDVKSFLPKWDSRTSRQIQVKNGWIIYGSEKVLLPLQYRPHDVVVTKENVLVMRNESGEVTFWEFADEEED